MKVGDFIYELLYFQNKYGNIDVKMINDNIGECELKSIFCKIDGERKTIYISDTHWC